MAQRLSCEERAWIEAMRAAGVSVEETARRLGRHRSTVYRELEPRTGDVFVASNCGVLGRDEVLHVSCGPLRRDPDLNLVAAVY